jgi:hypothetical protein
MNIGPLHLLSVFNLGLGLGLASLWVDPNAQPLPSVFWTAPTALPPEIATPTVALMTDPQGGNPDAYPAISARPLFALDRRPPPPPAPPVIPPPPDLLDSVHLTGLFTGPHGGVLAGVQGRMTNVKIGQNIGAWTLETVEGREATFKQGEQERKLRLAYARLNVSVGPPAGAVSGSATHQQPTAQNLSANQLNPQGEQLERTQRRNRVRKALGLPPLPEQR